MNGIEKIVSRIESEAGQEADKIRAEAQAQCEEIGNQYEKTAQDEYWRIVRAGVKDCELRVQHLSKTAAMEAKKSLLSLKQEMILCAFERAKELIRALPEGEYVAFLARMAAQAASVGTEEVIFNDRDKKQFGNAAVDGANELLKARGISAKLTVSEQTKPIFGGVIVKHGDIEANCSIESLVELCRNDLVPQVVEVMFDEGR